MDVPVDEVETREAETFFSKKGGPEALFDDPVDDGWDEELAEEFLASEELAQFDSLRKVVLHRIQAALDRGVEKEELLEAFKDLLNGTSNADSTAAEYLFQSEANALDFAHEIEAARHTLLAAYPLLIPDDPDDVQDPDLDGLNAGVPGEYEVTDATIAGFFANFEVLYEYETGEGAEKDDCDNQDHDDNGDGNDEGAPEDGEECDDSNGGGCSWMSNWGWRKGLKFAACGAIGVATGVITTPVVTPVPAAILGTGAFWGCGCMICDDPLICEEED